MEHILDSIDRQTQLAGENRMELLLFRLTTKQVYGINVFKIKEVINPLPLTLIPTRHPIIRGISPIRGITIPIIDLSMAIGSTPLSDPEKRLIVVAEYNRTVQGFMVGSVVKIVNVSWENVHQPPAASGNNCYLTAVVEIDGELVEIIDVEKILQEIAPAKTEINKANKEIAIKEIAANKELVTSNPTKQVQDITKVLVCDDSVVARKQIIQSLKQLNNMELIVKNNGKEALDYLKENSKNGHNIANKLLVVISDVEMPEMDGYTLTAMIREDPNLKDLHVVLHTSLSGVFNNALITKVGANQFIAKFDPNALAKAVTDRMQVITTNIQQQE